jgi:hypothetical protein
MSDMLMVVVWKDLVREVFGRRVDEREREIDLEDCKRERRKRSMALEVLIGLYGRFWV